MIKELCHISPELTIFIVASLVLIGDIVFSPARKRWLAYLTILGLFVSLFMVFNRFNTTNSSIWNGMLVLDPLSHFFHCLILIGAIFVSIMTIDYKGLSDARKTVFYSVLLFAVLSMMFLASSNDLIMIFLSMEFLGISSYILVGFARADIKSSESAVKYFLVGAFSSAIMLYGMSLVYGLTKSTNLHDMSEWYQTVIFEGKTVVLSTIAIVFILVGFGFKIALVPFHMWVPDVYEGAPTPMTAFLAVASKAIGVSILLRTFLIGLPAPVDLLAILSAITMTVGNLAAIPQKNIKRLLAYSSIGHIGYIMIGFCASSVIGNGMNLTTMGIGNFDIGIQGIFIYLFSYLFMTVGAFTVVTVVSNNIGSEEINDYAGLSQKSPFLAYILTLFLLSLTGIPPTAGFLAKFYVFSAAIKENYLWLAIVGIVNSAIALYYYFRIVHKMFFVPSEKAAISATPILKYSLITAGVAVLVIGMFPQFLIELIQVSIEWWS